MIRRGQTVASLATAGSVTARMLVFLANSVAMRFLLALCIIMTLVFVPRPSQPIAVLVLLAASLFIVVHRTAATLQPTFRDVFRTVIPHLMLFVAAAVLATATAFVPSAHLMQFPKILALQLAVLVLYCLGRLVGPIPYPSLLGWIFGILAVSTLLLLVEEGRFTLHIALGVIDTSNPAHYAALNRAFLIVSLALAFLAITSAQLNAWIWCILCLVLMGLIAIASHSDSARLVAVIMLLGLVPSLRLQRALLSVAFAGAVLAMVVGPFVYDFLLQAWKASPVADYKIGTFLYRLETYADFSALIRESHFLARGFDVSKLIANDPSLFAMPNRPCGQTGAFCPWHPHNAGLQVTTDLGVLGIAWLTLVLWSVRRLVLALPDWQQPGVIGLIVSFLAVSFVADGLWQAWWWLVAGLIAMWIGMLAVTPEQPTSHQGDDIR